MNGPADETTNQGAAEGYETSTATSHRVRGMSGNQTIATMIADELNEVLIIVNEKGQATSFHLGRLPHLIEMATALRDSVTGAKGGKGVIQPATQMPVPQGRRPQ